MSQNLFQKESTNIQVEVVYAGITEQIIKIVSIPKDGTVKNAIEKSGILLQFPEIDLNKNKLGIFSQPASLSTRLEEGERVEIYRPLITDPKQARRLRAKKIKK